MVVKFLWLALVLGEVLFGDTLTVQIAGTFPSPDTGAISGAGINDLRQVALWTTGTGAEKGFGSSYFRDTNGAVTHFAFPGSTGGHARGINSNGEIVGEYFLPSSKNFGYIRSSGGSFTDLGPQLLDANGINKNDSVAGDAYIRDANGNVTAVSYPGASSYTSVEAINDLGDVVGEYCCVNGSKIPFIRTAGGAYTGFPSLAGSSFLGINALGQILGLSPQNGNFRQSSDGSISYIMFPGSQMTANGGSYGLLGLNNQGQVVGVLANGQGFTGTLVSSSTLTITTTSPLPPGAVGEFYQSLVLTASGGAPPYSWFAINGNPPPGLNLINGTDTLGNPVGAIVSNPAPTTAGTYTFTLRVTDSASLSTTETVSITIAGPLAIATPSPLPTGTLGVPYSATLAASGGTPPNNWYLPSPPTPNVLPLGLSMSNSGVISGTPTAIGTTTFTADVYDRGGANLKQVYSLTIGSGLAITTTSPLPSGTVGAAYSTSLSGTGGAAPYIWTVISGSLPAGLTLSTSGIISGNPTSPGASNITFRLTDNTGATLTQVFTLTISPAGALSIDTASPLPPGTTGVPYSQTLSASGGTAPFRSWTVVAGTLPPGIALTTVGASVSGLVSGVPTAAGTYSFTVQATDGAGTTATKQLSITVNTAGISISSGGVGNSASYATAAVSPGELVVIFGTGLGPSTLVGLQLDGRGYVSTSLSGTQVLFDGLAAPLVYTEAGQVSAIVPYEVYGRSSTKVQVTYQGQGSNTVSLPVALVAPGIFTALSSGSGQGSILNQDGSVNSPSNPAAAGSVISVFGTGEGQTNPGGIDGKPDVSPAPVPNQPVTATISGVNAQVTYAGGSPGLVAGVLQVNVQIPAGTASGVAPIVLNVGGTNTQPNVTVAIK